MRRALIAAAYMATLSLGSAVATLVFLLAPWIAYLTLPLVAYGCWRLAGESPPQ